MGIGIIASGIKHGMDQLQRITIQELKLAEDIRRGNNAASKISTIKSNLNREGGDSTSISCIDEANAAAASVGIAVPGFSLTNPSCPGYGRNLVGEEMASAFVDGNTKLIDVLDMFANPEFSKGLEEMTLLFNEAGPGSPLLQSLTQAGYQPTGSQLGKLLNDVAIAQTPDKRREALIALSQDPNAALYLGQYMQQMGFTPPGIQPVTAEGFYKVSDAAKVSANNIISLYALYSAAKATHTTGNPAITAAENNVKDAAKGLATADPDTAEKARDLALSILALGLGRTKPADIKPIHLVQVTSAGTAAAATATDPAKEVVSPQVLQRLALAEATQKMFQQLKTAPDTTFGAATGVSGRRMAIMQNTNSSYTRVLLNSRQYGNWNRLNGVTPSRFRDDRNRAGWMQRAANEARRLNYDPQAARNGGAGNGLPSFEQISSAFTLFIDEAVKYVEALSQEVMERNGENDKKMTDLKIDKQIYTQVVQGKQGELQGVISMVLGGGRG
jgi:hypothetical protein